jgi:5S rRNA maturation endonuclease (ribonuclease M5)
MIKHIKKRIAGWVIEEMQQQKEELVVEYRGNSIRGAEIDDSVNDTIHFDLTAAIGGRILKVRRYDKNHNQSAQIYIITDSDNIGERVSKIINLEMIK